MNVRSFVDSFIDEKYLQFIYRKTIHVMHYKVTLRHVRAIIVAVEKH